MKKLIIINMLVFLSMSVFSVETNDDSVKHSPENSYCFHCHGSPTYSYNNELQEQIVTKRMNPYYMIDSILFYTSNHKVLECLDCHSYDYKTFPHNNELQMEPLPACLDCHEGDDVTANFHFEKINQEFKKSVHFIKHPKDFTCFRCHNPHSYKINVRSNENIKETIVYDNNICLSCHANINKYQLITSNKNPNIIKSHDWLPNQIVHFAHVRCIECHTKTTNDVLVAHQIQAKNKAVKKCVECHSKNSMLMASLYKFQAKEKRNLLGFSNAAILSNSYLIGANRNYYLNVISGVVFGFVVLLIIIHVVLRILMK